jgi:hypothetical protein
MNKWAEACGAEVVINQLAAVLLVENPESRTEGLKWILEHTDSIPDADLPSLTKPLTACLTDKSKAIRELSEKVILIVMPIVGASDYMAGIKNFKPAI